MQADSISGGGYLRNIGDICPGRLICLCMARVMRDRKNVSPVFDLKFERPPLQSVSDVISFHTVGCVGSSFHFNDERVNFVMLT